MTCPDLLFGCLDLMFLDIDLLLLLIKSWWQALGREAHAQRLLSQPERQAARRSLYGRADGLTATGSKHAHQH